MRFERAFTATAMCAPMRQQMYTGIFPVRNGAYPNHSQSKPGVKSIPHYFEPLGYRVALSGKKHFGPPENYPFEFLGEGKDIDYAEIDEFIARDPEQPYFLVACSNEPHLPWNPRRCGEVRPRRRSRCRPIWSIPPKRGRRWPPIMPKSNISTDRPAA